MRLMTWTLMVLFILPAASALASIEACAGTCIEADLDDVQVTVDGDPVIQDGIHLPVETPALGDRSAQEAPEGTDAPAPSSGFAAARHYAAEKTEEAMQEPAGRAGIAALIAMLTTTVGWSSRVFMRAGFWAARAAGIVFLFSRIHKDDLTEHPVRAKVMDALEADPGITLRTLQARLDVAWGTAVYHVNRLEKEGLIVSQHEGNRRLFFLTGTTEARLRADLAMVQGGTSRRIAQTVMARPGVDQKTVCQALSITNPTASKHLSRLEKRGLVESRKVSRSRLYRPTAALFKAMQVAPAPGGGTSRSTSPSLWHGLDKQHPTGVAPGLPATDPRVVTAQA